MSDAMMEYTDWHVVSMDPKLAAAAFEHAWPAWSEVVHRERWEWFVSLAWPRSVSMRPWSPYVVSCPLCKAGYETRCVGKIGPEPARGQNPFKKGLVVPERVAEYRWSKQRERLHARRWLAFATALRAWYHSRRPAVPEELYCITCKASDGEWCDMAVEDDVSKVDGTIHLGDSSFPPGSSSGLVVKRNPDTGELRPQEVDDSPAYIQAAKELAALTADWSLYVQTHPAEKPRSFQEAVLDVLVQCWHVLMLKRYGRGVENLKEQGELGILNRVVRDKGQRLLREADRRRFAQEARGYGMPDGLINQYVPSIGGESFDDDAIDSINYYVLLLLLRAGYLDLEYQGAVYDR